MIAITAPLKPELAPLLSLAKNVTIERVGYKKIYHAHIGEQKLILCTTGHGKINTASVTQKLLDSYSPKGLIHIGSAGAIDPSLSIGDLVIASEVIEHDYYELFGNDNINRPAQRISETFIHWANHSNSKDAIVIKVGKIISGCEDIVTTDRRTQLFQAYNALSVDWESASSTQVCHLNSIPTIVIRTISDYASENTGQHYTTHLPQVTKKLGEWLHELILKEPPLFLYRET